MLLAIASFIPGYSFAIEKYEIQIINHVFQPSEITVPANTKVKLVVKNMDQTPEEFESNSLYREKIIRGNSQAIMFIGPLKPGEYKFYGEFNPKTAKGKIIVK
jgi:hypothetical protein